MCPPPRPGASVRSRCRHTARLARAKRPLGPGAGSVRFVSDAGHASAPGACYAGDHKSTISGRGERSIPRGSPDYRPALACVSRRAARSGGDRHVSADEHLEGGVSGICRFFLKWSYAIVILFAGAVSECRRTCGDTSRRPIGRTAWPSWRSGSADKARSTGWTRRRTSSKGED